MLRTAIMVDGGYYRKRAERMGKQRLSGEDRAKELAAYCAEHISGTFAKDEERRLYRIFYYDCPPYSGTIVHPLTNEKISMADSPTYEWTTRFFETLKKQRKFALRMGRVQHVDFQLKPTVLLGLLSNSIELTSITKNDFETCFKQKGVDMRIGLDIASLAQKRLVDQIILIAGDSDFVPVIKHARREGIDFILDPMEKSISADLSEHVDGIQSVVRIIRKQYETDETRK